MYSDYSQGMIFSDHNMVKMRLQEKWKATLDSLIVFTKRLLPANKIRNFPMGFRGQHNTNKPKFMLYKDGFTGRFMIHQHSNRIRFLIKASSVLSFPIKSGILIF